MVNNTLQDNTTFWSPYYTGIENAVVGDAIVSGCSISKGTGDWDIDITAGAIIESWTEASTTTGTVTLTAPASDADMDTGESRIDLIHIDTGDTLAATEGTAATNPDAPDLPASEVLVGFVVIAESDSTVAASDIIDLPAWAPPERSTSIKIWSGSIASIPTGWVLCDGNNSTPNLQDKFVVGAGNTFSVDGTGGESTHTLTESELASHNHSGTYSDTVGTGAQATGGTSGSTASNVPSAGGDSAHENKPPYHALAYIMKT